MGLRIMHVGHDGSNWHANGYVIAEIPAGYGIFMESDEGMKRPEEVTATFEEALFWCYNS